MSETVRRELGRIARGRRATLVEMAALLAALGLLVWAERLGAADTPETATLLLLGGVGFAGGSLRFAATLAALLTERCPRCGGAFFVSLERVLWSLPFPRGRCAHCGVGLRLRPPRSDAPDPAA
jgi:hypothetical protein